MFDESGVFVQLPSLVKASQEGDRRFVEINASKQVVDAEGDIILQSALINSGPAFVAKGHLDRDHLSEIGERLGIQNTSEFIVGNPTAVQDMGGGATWVRGELQKGNRHADEIWGGLNASPPVRWQASIYGFPTYDGLLDARVSKAEDMMGATRFLVKALDWRSLAFTRTPVNQSVDAARIYTAKSFLAFMKGRFPGASGGVDKSEALMPVAPIEYILPPRNRLEHMAHAQIHMKRGECPCVNSEMGRSIYTFRNHFMTCCGMGYDESDISALALMQLLKREKSDA